MKKMNAGSTEKRETGRLESFSDGVFAVAITLLILDVKLPVADLSDPGLWKAMLGQGPRLIAFVTSFFTIGIVWINHHRLFAHIKRTDTGLLLINLLLLFVVVVIPVTTALLAGYLQRPDQHAAAVLYSATFFLLACCVNGLWRYASYRNRLLGHEVDQDAVRAIHRQYLFGPVLYAIAFALAWFNSTACTILELLLALFFALRPRPPRRN
jgi:uncharacterized membrane protein